jgi:DNA-binding response OmpR family regulator
VEKNIVLLDANPAHTRNLCDLLQGHAYRITVLDDLADVWTYLPENDCGAIVLNLDTIPVSNRTCRQLKQRARRASIIALSQRTHHPELEEALREHISVCLTKPTDPDELVYWLNVVFENAT